MTNALPWVNLQTHLKYSAESSVADVATQGCKWAICSSAKALLIVCTFITHDKTHLLHGCENYKLAADIQVGMLSMPSCICTARLIPAFEDLTQVLCCTLCWDSVEQLGQDTTG